MKRLLFVICSFILNFNLEAKPILNKELITGFENCTEIPNRPRVWLFKQWHLSPKINTFLDRDFKKLPQEKNQTAIYQQIASWIDQKQISVVLAEGCQEKELNEKSSFTINGWNYQNLSSQRKEPWFFEIVTSVPLKLEVKYQEQIKTICADDLSLIEKNGLAFSNARAALGFLSRLQEYKNDEKKLMKYLEAVKEVYHLSAQTKRQDAEKNLIGKLKEAIKEAQAGIEARNKMAWNQMAKLKEQNFALVFGGIHAPGLKEIFEKNHFNCTIVTPTGYADNDSGLLEALKLAVQKL